jgi:hypothetical protein
VSEETPPALLLQQVFGFDKAAEGENYVGDDKEPEEVKEAATS